MLPRRRLEGCYAGQASERGLAAASAWVGPGDEHLGGGDRANPELLEQLRSCGCDQFGDGRFQFGYLGGQSADASGYRTHGLFGSGEFASGTRGWLAGSERVTFGDQRGGGETSELVSEIHGPGYY